MTNFLRTSCNRSFLKMITPKPSSHSAGGDETDIIKHLHSVADTYPFFSVKSKNARFKRDYIDSRDIRPKVFDKILKMWLLLDTGAAITCWPKDSYPNNAIDTSRIL